MILGVRKVSTETKGRARASRLYKEKRSGLVNTRPGRVGRAVPYLCLATMSERRDAEVSTMRGESEGCRHGYVTWLGWHEVKMRLRSARLIHTTIPCIAFP
jgi:hypothetical protein